MSGTLEVATEINGDTLLAGTAYLTERRGSLSTVFVYERGYLANKDAYPLDPELALDSGTHAVTGAVGAFSDCAPDRWGRNLIAKRIRAQALREHSTPPVILEIDYLTGVSDLTRQGALRFRLPGTGEFVHPDSEVPRLVDLPELLHASDAIGRDPDGFDAIKVLLAAGTGTLGGARPKASVRDQDRLFIAKFPKPDDAWDVMAWEKTALDLAENCGITVPRHRLEHIEGHSVLLLERFDRAGANRIGYISAMTVLQAHDGSGGDYVELAERLSEIATASSAELEQLWRRVAFSCLIHNTDDHLRNYGFLRERSGWKLSPAFDLNPNPDLGEARQTGIGGFYYPGDEINGLMSYASNFRLKEQRAREVLGEVLNGCRNWREIAANNGISSSEINAFSQTIESLRAMAERRAVDPAHRGTRQTTSQLSPDTTGAVETFPIETQPSTPPALDI